MRDDQKRALLADGGKGEAVYQYKVRDLSGWHDCDAGAYERITTNMPEHVEARTLFTAPQAIGKGEAVAKVANFMFKGVKPTSHVTLLTDELLPDGTLLYTALQAECALREAQPVVEAMQAYLRQCRAGGMPKDVSDQIERAVNQANHLGYFAAPTPERAQEGA